MPARFTIGNLENVWVGSIQSSVGSGTGGRIYSVKAQSGSINGYSAQLDNTWGIRDGVLMDSVAQMAYVFIGNDPSGANDVYQFPLNFTSSMTPASVPLSTPAQVADGDADATGSFVYQLSGAFDNTYYNSPNENIPSGNIYVCGTGYPATLYQIGISGNSLGTVTAGPVIGATSSISADQYWARCSPTTEFYNTNTSTDYVFVSVFEGSTNYNGSPSNCQTNFVTATDGCVLTYNVTLLTSSTFSSSLTPGGTLDVSAPSPASPTSGIIIDNSGGSAGESQIYFVTQTPDGTTPCTGVCAVQASQAALQ